MASHKLSAKGAQKTAAMKAGKHDPSLTKTFIRPYSEESVCAAYNGYDNVGEFRNFLVTAQFVDRYLRFRKLAIGLPSNTILQLLLTNESAYKAVTTYENAKVIWPIQEGHRHGREDKDNRYHQIAHHLYHTAAWMRNMRPFNRDDPEQAWLQDKAKSDFADATDGLILPDPDFNMMLMPQLGPFQGESAVESFNRVFCMFRYFQYVSTSKHWNVRFSGDTWRELSPLPIEAKPGWMRTSNQVPPQPKRLSDLKALPKIPRQNWKILWKRGANFPEKKELDQHLEAASTPLPSYRQILDIDPQLCADLLQWRDCIKRQYKCLQLGMTVHSIHLTHSTEGDDEEVYNLQDMVWTEVKSTFADLTVEDVLITVIFRKLYEGEEIWESDQLPWVTPSNWNLPPMLSPPVRFNFPGEDYGMGEDYDMGEADSIQGDSSVMQHDDDLDTFFTGTHGGLADRASPKPTDFFEANDPECTTHHSGHDVTTSAAALLDFQQHALAEVAGVPPPARKPSRSKNIGGVALNDEEEQALEEAIAAGESAAMTREVVDLCCLR